MVLAARSLAGAPDGGLPREGETTVARAAGPIVRADGVELLGPLEGSGYRQPPQLVRRSDGQMLQLTPVLYAVLEAIDDERTVDEIAAAVEADHGLAVDPEDISFLIDERLRPLGVLRGTDGSAPTLTRSNPLLGLRGRVAMVGAGRTTAIARRMAPLFKPPVVAAVVGLFLASSWWLFTTERLGAATRDLFHQPGAFLAVLALTIASGAFHEIGHASACYYGGASPGPMGAGLYLVWPAFYTDVSDSYRLDRRGRLRVDLGGLYFNAIFSIAAFGLWTVVGWNPLLILMFLQLLQMARQLAPLVRFDGYHVLADLVGVPDLFARVRPVLVGLLPFRWRDPEARVLKPWARAVVSAWVLTVVPILLLSLAVMVLSFPRLAATAADSMRGQWSSVAHHWSNADFLRASLSVLGLLTIALPVASVSYLLTRLGRRAGTKAWRATEGNSRARRALVLALVVLALTLAAAWWPQGQYRAIDPGEALSLPALATFDDRAAPDRTDASRDLPIADVEAARATAARSFDMATAPATTDDGSGLMGGHVFDLPAAPRAHDNQAVAVGYDDGATTIDVEHSIDWADAGDVDHRNEAHALASCIGCRTTAVAFQLVLVVGDHSVVSPRNVSIAENVRCLRCTTRALAVQLVLPLDERPDAATMAELDQIWARLADLERTVTEEGFAATQTLINGIETDVVALLAPGSDVLEETTTTTADPPTTTTAGGVGDTSTTSTSDEASSTTTTSESTTTSELTTTTADATTTTTTTGPTTTTQPPPDPSPPP